MSMGAEPMEEAAAVCDQLQGTWVECPTFLG